MGRRTRSGATEGRARDEPTVTKIEALYSYSLRFTFAGGDTVDVTVGGNGKAAGQDRDRLRDALMAAIAGGTT
jgi:hypothetical protein